MKHIIESREDLREALEVYGVEIVDEKKIQKDGRLYFGKERADQRPELAVLDWDQEGAE